MNRFLTTPRHLENKMSSLIELIRSYGRVAVAFSGGVDSTFLAEVCAHALPACDVILLHLDTPLVGTPERRSFERLAHDYSERGIEVVSISFDPLAHPNVLANPADRCYHCKRLMLTALIAEARRRGFALLLDGSNADDAHDYRPGMQAVRELGVRSPLMECGWAKREEREVLELWGNRVWDLPAGACLATRIPCGEALTRRKLDIVRACENRLHEHGLRQVRVRLHNGVARVSADAEALNALARMLAEDARECEGSTHNDDRRAPVADDAHLGNPADASAAGSRCSSGRGSSMPLLPAIADELLACGACGVDPHVYPYLHGETSISPKSRLRPISDVAP